MSLAKKLAGEFDSGIRSRGQQYYWQRLVRIRRGSAAAVEATVRGSTNYEVELEYDRGRLHVWCDCPYFESEGPCKHVWATILAADGYRHLTQSAAAASLMLAYDGSDTDDDFDYQDQHEEFSSSWRSSKPAPKPIPPKLPAWRQQLSDLQSQRAFPARNGDAWPPGKEILYVVDVPSSAQAGAVVLSFQSRARKAKGDWSRPKVLTLRTHQVATLPAPEDRGIFSALSGSSPYFSYAYSSDYATFNASHRVPHPLAATLLPAIAGTGRGFLRAKPESDELTPLAWGQGATWCFRLELLRSDRGAGVTDCSHRVDER